MMNHNRDHAKNGDADACDLPMPRLYGVRSKSEIGHLAKGERCRSAAFERTARFIEAFLSLGYVIDHPQMTLHADPGYV